MTIKQNLHPAERLVLLRETLGFSQREMAKEFQVSSGAIASWETGTRVVPGPVLKLIDLYEKSLPTLQKERSGLLKSVDLLSEIKNSFGVGSSESELLAIEEIHTGARAYFEDAANVNSLSSSVKIFLIQRLLKSLKNSKGISVKIAQLASFFEMGLPVEVRLALGTLQSRSQPTKAKAVQEIIESEYGKPLKEVFSYWREEPIAVTSIGQVHYAKLPSGKEVAVKVQHPEIREIIQKQFRNLDMLRTLGSFFSKNDGNIIEEIKSSLFQECDFLLEARNQEKFRNILSENPHAVIPHVYRELARERVLVTEYIRAESFQSFVAKANQYQRNLAAETIIECLTTAAFGYCTIHTDLHPGNFLFVDGKVVFLDFGRVIEVSRDRMKDECRFYLALLHRDYDKGRILADKVGFAKEAANFDFDDFWNFLLGAHTHLLVDDRFKFTREYVQLMTRQGRSFTKKNQLKINRDAFWAFVFSASSWGVLADLEADINFRKIAMKTLSLAESL